MSTETPTKESVPAAIKRAGTGKVEAAGIEPASCDSSAEASTCVFD